MISCALLLLYLYVHNDQKLFERGWYYNMVRGGGGIYPTNERQQNGERYSVTLLERQALAVVRTSAHGAWRIRKQLQSTDMIILLRAV